MGQKPLYFLTKVILDVLFYGGMLICLLFPFIINALHKRYYIPNDTNISLLYVTLLPSGISGIYLLQQLRNIYATIIAREPFIFKNVIHLKKITIACFFIALLYIVRLSQRFTFYNVIICIVFFIATLFASTLKNLFEEAVLYKTENDWTV